MRVRGEEGRRYGRHCVSIQRETERVCVQRAISERERERGRDERRRRKTGMTKRKLSPALASHTRTHAHTYTHAAQTRTHTWTYLVAEGAVAAALAVWASLCRGPKGEHDGPQATDRERERGRSCLDVDCHLRKHTVGCGPHTRERGRQRERERAVEGERGEAAGKCRHHGVIASSAALSAAGRGHCGLRQHNSRTVYNTHASLQSQRRAARPRASDCSPLSLSLGSFVSPTRSLYHFAVAYRCRVGINCRCTDNIV